MTRRAAPPAATRRVAGRTDPPPAQTARKAASPAGTIEAAGGADRGATRPVPLDCWYRRHGRHDLPWRLIRDRWAVLVSEVMLQQTQVNRVTAVWPDFMARFPTPQAMAAAPAGDVITAWGRLGYPRRARRLWEAAGRIAADGWPADLTDLPGVGRYTAEAIAAQVDDADAPAVETNIRRVVERRAGRLLSPSEAAAASRTAGHPLTGRDRLLALMDVGALLCRPRDPRCGECPLEPGCATAPLVTNPAANPQARRPSASRTNPAATPQARRPSANPTNPAANPQARRPSANRTNPSGARRACEPSSRMKADDAPPPAGGPAPPAGPAPWRTLGARRRQAAYEGSFRQRRGQVLARLREGPHPSADLDPDALASLVEDGLATLDGPLARLP